MPLHIIIQATRIESDTYLLSKSKYAFCEVSNTEELDYLQSFCLLCRLKQSLTEEAAVTLLKHIRVNSQLSNLIGHWPDLRVTPNHVVNSRPPGLDTFWSLELSLRHSCLIDIDKVKLLVGPHINIWAKRLVRDEARLGCYCRCR